MPLAKGINSHVGFGAETTYGTAGTIDEFYRLLSENMRHVKEMFVSESLNPDWNDFIYYSHGKNEGSLTFEHGYTGLELFWHSLMGTYSYVADTPAVGANTHIFTNAFATNDNPSLSVEVVRGIGGTDELTYLGCYPSKVTLEFAPRQLMRSTWDMVGQGFSRAAATSATFPTDNFIVPNQKTTLSIAGSSITILSGSIEVEAIRAVDREHYGETFYKEPVVIGRPTGKFSLECEFSSETGEDTNALLEAFEDETELNGMTIAHEGSIITGATPYTFTLSAAKVWIVDATPSVSGYEITGVTINGRITNGCTVSFINDSTEAT